MLLYRYMAYLYVYIYKYIQIHVYALYVYFFFFKVVKYVQCSRHSASAITKTQTCSIFNLTYSSLFRIIILSKFYLFIFRERGREREREGEKHWPANQACARTRNQTHDLLVCRPALNPLSHTSQGPPQDYF